MEGKPRTPIERPHAARRAEKRNRLETRQEHDYFAAVVGRRDLAVFSVVQIDGLSPPLGEKTEPDQSRQPRLLIPYTGVPGEISIPPKGADESTVSTIGGGTKARRRASDTSVDPRLADLTGMLNVWGDQLGMVKKGAVASKTLLAGPQPAGMMASAENGIMAGLAKHQPPSLSSHLQKKQTSKKPAKVPNQLIIVGDSDDEDDEGFMIVSVCSDSEQDSVKSKIRRPARQIHRHSLFLNKEGVLAQLKRGDAWRGRTRRTSLRRSLIARNKSKSPVRVKLHQWGDQANSLHSRSSDHVTTVRRSSTRKPEKRVTRSGGVRERRRSSRRSPVPTSSRNGGSTSPTRDLKGAANSCHVPSSRRSSSKSPRRGRSESPTSKRSAKNRDRSRSTSNAPSRERSKSRGPSPRERSKSRPRQRSSSCSRRTDDSVGAKDQRSSESGRNYAASKSQRARSQPRNRRRSLSRTPNTSEHRTMISGRQRRSSCGATSLTKSGRKCASAVELQSLVARDSPKREGYLGNDVGLSGGVHRDDNDDDSSTSSEGSFACEDDGEAPAPMNCMLPRTLQAPSSRNYMRREASTHEQRDQSQRRLLEDERKNTRQLEVVTTNVVDVAESGDRPAPVRVARKQKRCSMTMMMPKVDEDSIRVANKRQGRISGISGYYTEALMEAVTAGVTEVAGAAVGVVDTALNVATMGNFGLVDEDYSKSAAIAAPTSTPGARAPQQRRPSADGMDGGLLDRVAKTSDHRTNRTRAIAAQ